MRCWIVRIKSSTIGGGRMASLLEYLSPGRIAIVPIIAVANPEFSRARHAGAIVRERCEIRDAAIGSVGIHALIVIAIRPAIDHDIRVVGPIGNGMGSDGAGDGGGGVVFDNFCAVEIGRESVVVL